jgi:hypothetical protein
MGCKAAGEEEQAKNTRQGESLCTVVDPNDFGGLGKLRISISRRFRNT